MAHNRDKSSLEIGWREPSNQVQGERPQSISKVQRPLRRSARLNLKSGEYVKQQRSPTAKKTSQGKDQSSTPQPRRRKRLREVEDSPVDVLAAPPPKRPRPRASPQSTATRPADRETSSGSIDPIDYWRKHYTWPRDYFELEDNMNPLLARLKPSTSLRSKQTEGSPMPSSTTPSDQKPREVKSRPYQSPLYTALLEKKGVHMGRYVGENEEGITKESKELCQTLLETNQTVPKDSLFDEECFQDTYEMLQIRNEAKVIQDISRLIAPSAQSLAISGAKHLRHLIESVNEGWNNSVPLIGTRPQPDFSVGFKRTAFTNNQLDKLEPFVGDYIAGDQSYFMGTYYMYFPFLACEVKCGAAALDIADRQNAHSMTLAVRAVVELFRLVKREMEINRELLAFSISHDYQSIRIYGHYAVIDGAKTTFYRHPIQRIDITLSDGKDRWTAHKFTKNVYSVWMPKHFKRLCSAIDGLPSELDFDVPLMQSSGLSQGFESQYLAESTSQSEDERDITPNTSYTPQGTSRKGKAAK